jgi:hypothetical protein
MHDEAMLLLETSQRLFWTTTLDNSDILPFFLFPVLVQKGKFKKAALDDWVRCSRHLSTVSFNVLEG